MSQAAASSENNMEDNGKVAPLIAALNSRDGTERKVARLRLIEIGRPAVPALIEALQSPSEHVRWEAAKALVDIRDGRAAPALVRILEDPEPAVRWLAAEALMVLGRDGLIPLLQGLERRSSSVWFRDGAHHVLRALTLDGVAEEARPVLEALEDIEPPVEVPIAAHEVLERLKNEAREAQSEA
jgi:HEAT repeat protein